MALFRGAEREKAELISQLIKTNPFLPAWVQLERRLLGSAYSETSDAYHYLPWTDPEVHPNVARTAEIVEQLTEAIRVRINQGEVATQSERELYRDLALLRIYRRNRSGWAEMAKAVKKAEAPAAKEAWANFVDDFDYFFGRGNDNDYFGPFLKHGRDNKIHGPRETFFALFFQMVRAFDNIFRSIIGGSQATTRLRAAVWQSLFTHDIQRYYFWLHDRMYQIPTLICGPSGTGKELVAGAIGRSQYIPFDPEKREFMANFKRLFMAVNLSALAPGLIESELFGHCQAAFNGAKNRTGRLAECDPCGVIFLDEVGEIHQEVQVKLLRVLQTREFEAVGTNDTVEFKGKLVAATNQNLLAEMQAGAFRSDLFFRLCADQIVTPSLSEQLQNNPKDLGNLVLFIVRDVLGDEGDDESPEAFQLGEEATKWIHEKIPQDYAWSGNVRELGHCVRSFILRREYRLLDIVPGGSPAWELARAVESGLLTSNELEQRYYHLVYTQAGSYQEAGRRLGVNWRTVRTKIRESIKRVGG